MRRKRGHTQGLDQLGPTQHWKGLKDNGLAFPAGKGGAHTIGAKAKISVSKRKTKVTLSTSPMKADDIKD